MNKKVLWVSLAAVGIIVLVLLLPNKSEEPKEPEMGVTSNTSGEPVVLIGTRVSTTTTGVSFPNYTAGTTTYPFRIGTHTDDTSIFLKITNASTTAQGQGSVYLSILGSNDPSCDTASTTYSVPNNNIITSDIGWYDVSQHILNLAGSRTLSTATGTINWQAVGVGEGREITLENLNSKCLALEVNGSSTVIYAEFTTK